MSPAAQRLLTALADGYRVETEDPGGWDATEYHLRKSMRFDGDLRRIGQELRDAGLVDFFANGSGGFTINDKGRAALPELNGVGSDFDAWLKTSDGRWAYKLCVEKCTPKEAMNLLRRTFAAGAGNVADAQRLDFLEGEMERELTHPRTVTPTRSLFRRNVPVTRAEIDKAMQAWSEVEHRCTWCGTRHAGYYITDCPIPGKSLPSQGNPA